MSRAFIGVLVWTVLLKLQTQHGLALGQSLHRFHTSINQKYNIKRRISNKFDKPSSVRLKSPGDSFSTSIYKRNPINGSSHTIFSHHGAHTIFSNDQLSDQLRSDYEIWSSSESQAPIQRRIQRLSKRNQEQDRKFFARSKARFTKLVDAPENKPYVLDDDYSLVNYIDNWEGHDQDHKTRSYRSKSEKLESTKTRHQKRDLEDKEFQVEFHSLKKGNEFKGTLSNSYELGNGGRRKSSIHSRKVNCYHRSKCDRNYGYIDHGTNHLKSKTRYASCKKKSMLWGQKRAKSYPKLGPKSKFLEELESKSRSNMAAMGHAWHWATTRNYVMGALTPKKDFVTPHSRQLPQLLIPLTNLTDSLIHKTLEPKINHPQMQRAKCQNIIPVRNPMLHIAYPNLQISSPPGRGLDLAVKPVLNRNHVPANSANPTRRPSIYFNFPTKFINPYEDHYKNFQNAPFWYDRQGQPGFREVFGNPVRLSTFQRFTINPSEVRKEQFVNPSMALPGILAEPGKGKWKESDLVQPFKGLPVAKLEAIPGNQTNTDLDTADIVNLLQSALLPQKATTTEETQSALLPESISIDKMLEMIAPLRSTSTAAKTLTQTTENAVHFEAQDQKLIVDATKEALLSLFTTEGPMMESLEDILRRNADRKIPIVYDIEDAPQLTAHKSNNNEHPTKNSSQKKNDSVTEQKHHILFRRGILKKNKTAIKFKKVQKMSSTNTLTTPWIVLATTKNMLYSEIMEMQRQKLNQTKKSKTQTSTSKSKMNLLFKNKEKSNETNEPKVKSKRDQKAASGSRSSDEAVQVTSERRCGKCTCRCHPTPRPTQCCQCRERPPKELTTKSSCGPASLSSGSISCPDCHQEFTYKLNLRTLINC